MVLVGSLLALLSGMLNAAAAWLEKREGMRTATARSGLRLLAALARRPAWLAAMVLSALAWVGEAASLALAPVPIVATLRNAGRGSARGRRRSLAGRALQPPRDPGGGPGQWRRDHHRQ